MSVWYHYDVHTIAVDRAATARFFNLDPEKDVNAYADSFDFSFWGKNMPSLRLGKIIEQNPEMIFLVKERVEDSVSWWIDRNDLVADQHQHIFLYTSGQVTTQINKKILEEYTKEYPTLPVKHVNGEKGFEEFRWSMFLSDFGKVATMLRRQEEYKEMVNPYKHLGIPVYLVLYDWAGREEWHGPYPLEEAKRREARALEMAKDPLNEVYNVRLKEVESR